MAFKVSKDKPYVNSDVDLDFAIQAALVSDDATLIFTDHNVCFNIHIMVLKWQFEPNDISVDGGRVRKSFTHLEECQIHHL